MALREVGGILTRRSGSELQQSPHAILSGDFRASCQALFKAGGVFEDPEAADTLGKDSRGKSWMNDGGLVHCFLPGIPKNDMEVQPQMTVRQVALPIRALQRSNAPIGRGAFALGTRDGRERHSPEETKQDVKLLPAETPHIAEGVPAESVVLPATLLLPQIAAQSSAASALPTDQCPDGSEEMAPIHEPGRSFCPSTDHGIAYPVHGTQGSSPNGDASIMPALPESGASLPDGEIVNATSPDRTTPKPFANRDTPEATEANLRQGKKGISPRAFDAYAPREQAPAVSFESDKPDSESAQSKTLNGISPASPKRKEVRAEMAGPHISELHAQPQPLASNHSMQPKLSDIQHFGAEIMGDSSATSVGSSHDSLGAVRASQSSTAVTTGREVLAALDAEGTDSAPTWIRAGKHEVEAGYQDPELGWVTVRAHAVTNGIHAALVPGSMEAAQPLSDHLAGLNAYLADHHGGVHPVSVSSPEAACDELSAGQGMNHGSAQGDGREQPSGSGTGTQPGAARGAGQDSTLNTQQIDAIESLADFGRQNGTISLVV